MSIPGFLRMRQDGSRKKMRWNIKVRSIAGLMLIWVTVVGCMMQSDLNYLDRRISSLERRNAELDKSISVLEKQFKEKTEQDVQGMMSQSAGVQVMLQRIEEEQRILTGRVENLEHFSKTGMDSMEKLSSRAEDALAAQSGRIEAIENYLNLEKPQRKTEPEPFKPSEPSAADETAALSDAQLYAEAKQAFDQGEYEKARQGFSLLVSKYPKSERVDNAQFWLGETYYKERWYQKAILEYQKVIEKYPKGNKVAASMLKQAFSFFHLGDKSNCRLILNELVRKFPGSNESAVAKNKLKELQ